jgi:hypothetical protein
MALHEKVERLLLAGVDTIEAELARDLLQTAGVPVMLIPVAAGHRGFVEMQGGPATPSWNVFVPRTAFAKAGELLREAWDPAALDDRLALDTPRAQEPEQRSRTDGRIVALVVLAALIAVLFFGAWLSGRPG